MTTPFSLWLVCDVVVDGDLMRFVRFIPSTTHLPMPGDFIEIERGGAGLCVQRRAFTPVMEPLAVMVDGLPIDESGEPPRGWFRSQDEAEAWTRKDWGVTTTDDPETTR